MKRWLSCGRLTAFVGGMIQSFMITQYYSIIRNILVTRPYKVLQRSTPSANNLKKKKTNIAVEKIGFRVHKGLPEI